MQLLRRSIRRYARLKAPVLISGDTGTGKELVARGIHNASARSQGPFVAVNAASIPMGLAASELFGHERGAFTGAASRHKGAFEQASGGTLFLDEVADLSLELQAWLLRVVETQEIRALGARKPRSIDVRIVAAANIDWSQAVRSGRFREDLYYRLSVLCIRTPALREHVGDLPELIRHLFAGLDLEDDFEVTPDGIDVLAAHRWHGNVRELRAVLLRAAAVAERTTLTATDMALAIGSQHRMPGRRKSRLDAMQVAGALAQAHGNVARAARALDVPRSTLRSYLKRTEQVHIFH